MPRAAATSDAAPMSSHTVDELTGFILAAIEVGTTMLDLKGAAACLRELARRFDKRSFRNICEDILREAGRRGVTVEGLV